MLWGYITLRHGEDRESQNRSRQVFSLMGGEPRATSCVAVLIFSAAYLLQARSSSDPGTFQANAGRSSWSKNELLSMSQFILSTESTAGSENHQNGELAGRSTRVHLLWAG